MGNVGTAWYQMTVDKLSRYMTLKGRAEFLQEELKEREPKLTVNYRMTPGGGGISDQVGNLAQYKIDREAEITLCIREIHAIDRAVQMLNEPEQIAIKTRYLEGNKDSYAWRTLSLYGQKHQLRLNSRDTYYRLKEGALEKLARIFGFTRAEFQTFSGQKSDHNPDAKAENPCYTLN